MREAYSKRPFENRSGFLSYLGENFWRQLALRVRGTMIVIIIFAASSS
jgi:hypothetical protein